METVQQIVLGILYTILLIIVTYKAAIRIINNYGTFYQQICDYILVGLFVVGTLYIIYYIKQMNKD